MDPRRAEKEPGMLFTEAYDPGNIGKITRRLHNMDDGRCLKRPDEFFPAGIESFVQIMCVRIKYRKVNPSGKRVYGDLIRNAHSIILSVKAGGHLRAAEAYHRTFSPLSISLSVVSADSLLSASSEAQRIIPWLSMPHSLIGFRFATRTTVLPSRSSGL